jgi:hypothetical protein
MKTKTLFSIVVAMLIVCIAYAVPPPDAVKFNNHPVIEKQGPVDDQQAMIASSITEPVITTANSFYVVASSDVKTAYPNLPGGAALDENIAAATSNLAGNLKMVINSGETNMPGGALIKDDIATAKVNNIVFSPTSSQTQQTGGSALSTDDLVNTENTIETTKVVAVITVQPVQLE